MSAFFVIETFGVLLELPFVAHRPVTVPARARHPADGFSAQPLIALTAVAADAGDVNATYKDGILEVRFLFTVPTEAPPKKVGTKS